MTTDTRSTHKATDNGAASGQPQALSGIRVLDLSRVLAGPWASQILGDFGADIIKIEQPGKGDDTRVWGPPFWGNDAEQVAAYYLSCNRNKRSLALDIASPEGADIVRQLARHSDIVIENFKVGGLKKYGLDYGSLRAENPGLIYCSVTGFGQDGPYAGRGGYDFLIQAMGGLMSVTGPAEGEPGSEPTKVGVAVSDLFTGLYATIAIQAALRHREHSGEGQHIDCALLDSTVAILANQSMNYLVGGKTPTRMGNAHPNVVPYRPFAVADGHIVVAVGNDRQFCALCKLLGRDDLSQDPRFKDNAGRLQHRGALESQLELELAERQRDEILAQMIQHGVPGGPINTIEQVFADPHVQARELLQAVPDGHGGTLPLTRFPAKLSRTPASIRQPPPQLGEHSDELLRERLGLDAAQIAKLRQQGVLG